MISQTRPNSFNMRTITDVTETFRLNRTFQMAQSQILKWVTLAVAMVITSQADAYDGTCENLQEIAELPAGAWCSVPNSRLSDSEKAPSEWPDWDGSTSASYNSYQRVSGIGGITAYSGGAYDSKRDRLLIMGGGHNDYGGNEVFAFSLRTLTWERLTDPTPFPNRDPDTQNADGTPISRHTYNGIEYVPELDALMIFGGAPDSESGGCGVSGAWLYDLRSREESGSYDPGQWRRLSTESEPGGGCNVQILYDQHFGRVLLNNGSGWFKLDLATESWSELNNDTSQHTGTVARILEDQPFIVQVGRERFDGYMKRDLENEELAGNVVATSGNNLIERTTNPGFSYDVSAGKMIGWASGSTVLSLDLSSDSWTEHPAASENLVIPDSASGSKAYTYGRFQYSPTANVHILVTHARKDVLLYRFGGGGIKLVQPMPPAGLTAED